MSWPVSLARSALLSAAAAVAVLPLSIFGSTAGAAPAHPARSARPAGVDSCRGPVSSSIEGYTGNNTYSPITRVYEEKGLTNFWDPAPSEHVAARDSDHWCAYAYFFGTAVKVEYQLANGDKVHFVAEQYLNSFPRTSCSITRADPSSTQRCTTVSKRGSGDRVTVDFDIWP